MTKSQLGRWYSIKVLNKEYSKFNKFKKKKKKQASLQHVKYQKKLKIHCNCAFTLILLSGEHNWNTLAMNLGQH